MRPGLCLEPQDRGAGPQVQEAALTDLVARMRANPAASLRTERLASDLGVTPYTLIRAFKQVTGLSPQRFRAALRIAYAKKLIVDTEQPITEISLDTGYDSLGTFGRTFTCLVGVSPRALRRLARGEPAADDMGIARSPMSMGGERSLIIAHRIPPPCATFVVTGLFAHGIPAGLPLVGSFMTSDMPELRLVWPRGILRANLLTAAFRFNSLSAAWAGDFAELHVSNITLLQPKPETAHPVFIELRSIRITDPPILTPFPLLFQMQPSSSGLTS